MTSLTAEESKKLKDLHRKRGNIQRKLTLFHKLLDEFDPNAEDYEDLLAQFESLNTYWNTFEDIQFEIEGVIPDEEIKRDEMDSQYARIVARVNKLKSGRSNQSPPPCKALLNQQSVPIKLPEIPLPTFDGSYENWTSFIDLFTSLIDNNPMLNDVQKLHYLRSALKGKAQKTIQSLETTERNYRDALNLLKTKFECTRKIVCRHWGLLRDLPRPTKETPEAIGDLVDSIRQHLRALENLGQPVRSWDTPVIDLILSKISCETARQWELTLLNAAMPPYTNLLDFLEKRANCTEPVDTKPHLRINRHQMPKPNIIARHGHEQRQTFMLSEYTPCQLCKKPHPIRKCSKFLAMSVNQRQEVVSKSSVCFNCLSPTHRVRDCMSTGCYKCQQRHHTLLHPIATNEGRDPENLGNRQPRHAQANQEDRTAQTRPIQNPPPIPRPMAYVVHRTTSDLITTASLHVLNHQSHPVKCRTLIDTCSTTNFMTERLVQTLQIKIHKYSVPIGGLDSLKTTSKGIVTATIRSFDGRFERTIQFLTVPQIASLVPNQLIDRDALKIPRNLKLADPQFHKPAPVDMLLGSGISLALLCIGQLNIATNNKEDLRMQKTRLGWIVGGHAPAIQAQQEARCNLTNTDFDLERFWQIEESTSINQTKEEVECENHYQLNVSRREDGRYIVALPFNDKIHQLGKSKERAINRFYNLETKLAKNPDLKRQYEANLQEYIDLGHMTEQKEEPTDEGFYLPHHAVVKECSLTTKVRVVFDGSAKTSTNISLNQTLLTGPTLQTDLFALLIRFRLHPIVFTADIEKMYRQIYVRPEDRKFQRIIYRNSVGTIKTFELNTVTFGLAPSPYLAIRTLHQLAEDDGERYPLAVQALQKDTYVDDVATGAESVEEAREKRDQIIQLLRSGGFNIRQWASNNPELLYDLPKESINLRFQLGEAATLKTLGIYWNAENDMIMYAVKLPEPRQRVSKRVILSQIAQIFDPLGLLGPVICYAKIFMQQIWTKRLEWDESLPSGMHTEWVNFQNQLEGLNNLTFTRHVRLHNSLSTEIHGFCDASEKAYGACIYIRSTDNQGLIKTELLCAKSRVAPLKSTTIPRLELCGALMLSSLYKLVIDALQIKVTETYLWTDSTIVLHWLKTSEPHQLKQFVANRVTEILTKTSKNSWYHVRTDQNPADILSRGLKPLEFTQKIMWQNGPEWLQEPKNAWPITELPALNITIPETKRNICFQTTNNYFEPLIKYSSMSKLEAVIAYCMRFKLDNKSKGALTVNELQRAQNIILRVIQNLEFAEEIQALRKTKTISRNSSLLPLQPFIDQDGLLRVGGRLKNATISYSQRHQIILPKAHHVTMLIIRRQHINDLHAGIQNTLYSLRQKYWIPSGKNQVRKIVRGCIVCCRHNPPTVEYLMGDLPAARVTVARPFSKVAIDYCGPFFIKEKRHRSRVKQKIYVAIFTCLVVKAVHIEIVSDLTTEAFIAALQRFVSRRGICSDIYSDNATNFVGANKELSQLQQISTESHVKSFINSKGIHWHFIPARSPNFNGLCEAAVKSFKHHLKRVVGTSIFTYEQFTTLSINIEAILNSRPLTPLSLDPNDPQALSPSHFLIGDTLTALPEQNLSDVPDNRLSYWQHTQKVRQHFWKRWYKEYLHELTVRHKWTRGQPPIQWRLGIVTEIHPGKDGITRVVTVRTATGSLRRSLHKLAPLPIQQSE